MIRFALRCDNAHDFESWFKDGAAFDRMAAAKLVECPVCGDTQIRKALMAPAIAKTPGAKGRPEAVPAAAAPPAPPPVAAGGAVPAQVLALLQRVRAEVERNCDYVGRDFADTARRMAKGETEEHGIYGEASESEAEALRDEGIEVARIPWVPRSDG